MITCLIQPLSGLLLLKHPQRYVSHSNHSTQMASNRQVRIPSYHASTQAYHPFTKKFDTHLEHLANLRIDQPIRKRLTSIVCTIGPKTNNAEMIVKLRKAGMSIVRLNFSHGNHESRILFRKSYELCPGLPVAIALDTKGPEIRTGFCKNNVDVEVVKNSKVILSTNEADKDQCDGNLIYCDYKDLCSTVTLNQYIYVADGSLTLEVTEIDASKNYVICKALSPAKFGSRKNMSLPMCKVNLPSLSEQDLKDMQFALKHKVDIIFASFVRSAQDVIEMRNVLGDAGKNIKIISKIENYEGIHNYAEILDVSDGIMVARGDLGMDLKITKVFLAQKSIIAQANMAGKPIIVATQMLESMIKNPRPTRAEVTDCANAVFDGADAIMLSGESANGDYPVECVDVMNEICYEAESAYWNAQLYHELIQIAQLPTDTTETIAAATVNASFQQGAAAIIVLSTTGNSARLIAKYRPTCPIICVTRFAETARQLTLHRGCITAVYADTRDYNNAVDWQMDVNARLRFGIALGIEQGILSKDQNQTVLCLQGWAPKSGNTNTLRVLRSEDWK